MCDITTAALARNKESKFNNNPTRPTLSVAVRVSDLYELKAAFEDYRVEHRVGMRVDQVLKCCWRLLVEDRRVVKRVRKG